MASEPPHGDPTAPGELADLVRLVQRLRAPDGCPWDREQRLADLRAYLIEEAHETAAAIDAGDVGRLAEELGDLLFQVAFVIELAREKGGPQAAEVVRRAHAKLVSRHPHVFGDRRIADARSVERAWERRKQEERAARGEGLLAGVPDSLPALTGSYRLGQKAAGVGFDWPDVAGVLAKVDEERTELDAELGRETQDRDAVAHEIGDLLFATAQLARRLGLDPEAALAGANARFRERFAAMETAAARTGERLEDLDMEALENAWQTAKRQV